MPADDNDFVTVPCATCGIEFGITEAYEKVRKSDHSGFTCPNGHALAYSKDPGDSREVKELKNQVARLKETVNQLRSGKNGYDPEYTEMLVYLTDHPQWVPPWKKKEKEKRS